MHSIFSIVTVFGYFNYHRTTYDYHAPQSIGGGMQSQGGYVKMHETYHAPQSIGGGMSSPGGWSRVRDEPYVGYLLVG